VNGCLFDEKKHCKGIEHILDKNNKKLWDSLLDQAIRRVLGLGCIILVFSAGGIAYYFKEKFIKFESNYSRVEVLSKYVPENENEMRQFFQNLENINRIYSLKNIELEDADKK